MKEQTIYLVYTGTSVTMIFAQREPAEEWAKRVNGRVVPWDMVL